MSGKIMTSIKHMRSSSSINTWFQTLAR